MENNEVKKVYPVATPKEQKLRKLGLLRKRLGLVREYLAEVTWLDRINEKTAKRLFLTLSYFEWYFNPGFGEDRQLEHLVYSCNKLSKFRKKLKRIDKYMTKNPIN